MRWFVVNLSTIGMILGLIGPVPGLEGGDQPVVWAYGQPLDLDRIRGNIQAWTAIALLTADGPVSFNLKKHPELQAIPWIDHEAPGPIPMRFFSERGCSKWQLALIDSFNQEHVSVVTDQRSEASSIKGNSLWTQRLLEFDRHYYTFREAAGVRISLEVVANRVGSSMDPVLRVFDSSFKELLWVDDTIGYGRDVHATWTMPEEGRVTVELRDVSYGKGSDYFYLIKIGDIIKRDPETIERVERLERGDQGSVEGLGFYPGVFKRIPVAPFQSDQPTQWTYRNPTAVHHWSAGSDYPLDGQSATVASTLSPERPEMVLRVMAGPGEWLSFAAWTRLIGSENDLVLDLYGPEGGRVGRSWGEGGRQPWLIHEVKEWGWHRLSISELSRSSSEAFYFRCDFSKRLPGVRLSAKTESFQVEPGDELRVEVECERFGDSRDMEVTLHPQPDWLAPLETLISGDDKKKVLKWRVISDTPVGEFRMFRMLASGVGSENADPVHVDNGSALGEMFPFMILPPPELNGWFTLLTIKDAGQTKP